MHTEYFSIRRFGLFVAVALVFIQVSSATAQDLRNIKHGPVIPDEGYCDQPYVVVTDDGNWLCVLTTGPEEEGHRLQHIVACISSDKGQTWSAPIDIEPHGPPEASWVMPLKTPSGRVYVFYDYNGDDVHTLNGRETRVDMLGWYVYKYSDDNGRTWSRKRYRLPVRITEADRRNDWDGKVQMFWGVGKPIVAGGDVYLGFAKIEKYLVEKTEGWFFKSGNILTEPDPARIEWEMLPEGDRGLRAPQGPIAEEHNLVELSDSSLFCVYRTVDGLLCSGTSRNGARSWETAYATYHPGGRPIKQPRAPAFIRKFSNGNYLLLFHNNGLRSFNGRNPYWLCGGVEIDGAIHWSEPEICLYDDDPAVRIGYPDFIEDGGEFYLTETQKSIARIHKLDMGMLESLWGQHERSSLTQEGLALTVKPESDQPTVVEMPRLPSLAGGGGFSIEFWIRLTELGPGQIILDAQAKDGKGVAILTGRNGAVQIRMSDGQTSFYGSSDAGLLQTSKWHHVTVTADGGPKIVTFVIDGQLCDGGTERAYGWGRFSPFMGDVNGSEQVTIGDTSLRGRIKVLRVYNRYLLTSEAVGNWRAGS